MSNDKRPVGIDDVVLRDVTLADTLQQLVDNALGLVPGCDAASITLVRDERAVTAVATDSVALDLDHAQYELDHGPCLEACRTRRTIVVDCPKEAGDWRDFAQRALSEGFLAFLAVPLIVGDESVGALNLYSRVASSFDDPDVLAVHEFAARAAVLLRNVDDFEQAVRSGEHLREALASRAVIEQAKGVLMATRRVGVDEAFELLRDASQRANRKLRDVARDVVETLGERMELR